MKKKMLVLILGILLAGCGSAQPSGSGAVPEDRTQVTEQTSSGEAQSGGETSAAEASVQPEAGDASEGPSSGEDAQTVGAEEEAQAADPDTVGKELADRILTASGADESSLHMLTVSDYDRDGDYEAFAVVGETDEAMGSLTGAVWFAGDPEAAPEKLTEGEFWFHRSETGEEVIPLIRFDAGRDFFYIADWYVTSAPIELWSVRGDAPNLYFAGLSLGSWDPDGDLELVADGYDMIWDKEMEMFIGHTWKPYYFHYVPEEDAILAYKMHPITAEEVKEKVGRDLVAEIEAAGYTVGEMLYHENGIVHVNYTIETDTDITYCNVNFDTRTKQFLSFEGTSDDWSPEETGFGGSYSPED